MSVLIAFIGIPAGFAVFGGLVLFIIRLSCKLYKPFKTSYNYDYMYKKSGH